METSYSDFGCNSVDGCSMSETEIRIEIISLQDWQLISQLIISPNVNRLRCNRIAILSPRVILETMSAMLSKKDVFETNLLLFLLCSSSSAPSSSSSSIGEPSIAGRIVTRARSSVVLAERGISSLKADRYRSSYPFSSRTYNERSQLLPS